MVRLPGKISTYFPSASLLIETLNKVIAQIFSQCFEAETFTLQFLSFSLLFLSYFSLKREKLGAKLDGEQFLCRSVEIYTRGEVIRPQAIFE